MIDAGAPSKRHLAMGWAADAASPAAGCDAPGEPCARRGERAKVTWTLRNLIFHEETSPGPPETTCFQEEIRPGPLETTCFHEEISPGPREPRVFTRKSAPGSRKPRVFMRESTRSSRKPRIFTRFCLSQRAKKVPWAKLTEKRRISA